MPPEPLILAFDTSAAHCAAALLRGDVIVASRHEEMAKGQAERLMPLLDEVLQDGGADWRELQAIGVGIGPGNFTGIRISVAAARGLALSLGKPAIGVSLLECLAFGAEGPVLACLDARRDHLYLQRFATGNNRGPELVPIGDASDWALPGLCCIGQRADEVAEMTGLPHAPAAFSPASAIARIAATRWQMPEARPAPLYIRAADAAPPRDPAPVVLE
ncbi:tRNA (adenosine(37)-N6)-threonylcarbamoyltransferase complex dimerization subunit type 1 TsaB [Aliiroseovarius crassostreae]|uniref:tRNA (adenosine(37)-N6)-threonylcarbamoyltransferase complex dimerization subunit type 1 TsaB n=1 Tax=Aliiroseovarius crassostreae TaxID=154981 RepID=UPI0021B041BD|nr:tRNA (adenosine(37)-N6)-threonylcarbamoyltransferase complex dimerization subunit type 1 TsaB [Aliiroseovarius crassostreae]UWQ00986.1 tRNA (adenosine(37)-N6)-threonylcarbamoyltransferase complex dimerization subunit type 1 TsaB [Aliiroseovarius crassostreae]